MDVCSTDEFLESFCSLYLLHPTSTSLCSGNTVVDLQIITTTQTEIA